MTKYVAYAKALVRVEFDTADHDEDMDLEDIAGTELMNLKGVMEFDGFKDGDLYRQEDDNDDWHDGEPCDWKTGNPTQGATP